MVVGDGRVVVTNSHDPAHLAGPLLAAGRVQEALSVVSWEIDRDRRAACPCGQTFIINGFKTRCHVCRDECGHVDVLLGFKTLANGRRSPTKVCTGCGYMFDLPKRTPIGEYCFKDNRRVYGTHPCARCGSMEGTELHHWAPVSIFGWSEAERWPKAWLCTDCHTRWHRMMRRAKGFRLTEREMAEELAAHNMQQRGNSEQQFADGAADLRTVLDRWSDVVSAVRRRSRSTEMMMNAARVHAVEDRTLVMLVEAGVLRRRLAEDRNLVVVQAALAEILGGEWNIRWDQISRPASGSASPGS